VTEKVTSRGSQAEAYAPESLARKYILQLGKIRNLRAPLFSWEGGQDSGEDDTAARGALGGIFGDGGHRGFLLVPDEELTDLFQLLALPH